MENLITQVYESMPVPEQSRLSSIESKLLLKTKNNKLNKIPWWIVLVLAGGFASATWWAGEQWFDSDNKSKAELSLQSKFEIENDINLMKNNEQDTEGGHYQQRDTPVIYQRESF